MRFQSKANGSAFLSVLPVVVAVRRTPWSRLKLHLRTRGRLGDNLCWTFLRVLLMYSCTHAESVQTLKRLRLPQKLPWNVPCSDQVMPFLHAYWWRETWWVGEQVDVFLDEDHSFLRVRILRDRPVLITRFLLICLWHAAHLHFVAKKKPLNYLTLTCIKLPQDTNRLLWRWHKKLCIILMSVQEVWHVYRYLPLNSKK